MYLLPKNDKEFLDLCDLEQFKGRHNVIMEVKQYMENNDNHMTCEDFLGMIKRYNKDGWPNWC